MYSNGEWRETSNGNYVLIDDGIAATVFEKSGEWGGIWNGASDGQRRLLKAKCATAEEAMQLINAGIAEGAGSKLFWPPAGSWRRTKDGKRWYSSLNDGAVVSVKQARTGSWYATFMGDAMLGRAGRTTWFNTADEAKGAVMNSQALRDAVGSGFVADRAAELAIVRECLADSVLSLIAQLQTHGSWVMNCFQRCLRPAPRTARSLARFVRCTRILIILIEKAEQQQLPWHVTEYLDRAEARIMALGLPVPRSGEKEVSFH